MMTNSPTRRISTVVMMVLFSPLFFSCTNTVADEIIIIDRDGNKTMMVDHHEDSTIKRTAVTVSRILDEESLALAEEGGSAGFGIRSPNQEETDLFGNLHLTSLDEPLMAAVQNVTLSNRTFSLSLLLNLEPVSFSAGKEENFHEAFIFSLEPLEEVSIPLYLNPDAFNGVGRYALTAIVYALDPDDGSESFIVEEDSTFNYHEDPLPLVMALPFDLTYGRETEITLSQMPKFPDAQLSHSGLHGLSVLPLLDFNPASDLFLQIDAVSEELLQPDGSFVMQASPGEELILTYFANPFVMEHDFLENYGVIALLEGQPLEINDQPYLLVGSEDPTADTVDYGTFTVSAPEVAGRYTFVSLLVVNPHHLRSIDNFFPIETSIPFVIEVVE